MPSFLLHSPEWYTAFCTGALAAITVALAAIGFTQLAEVRRDTKVSRTIAVAEKYDFDPVFDRSLRRLRRVYDSGLLEREIHKYELDLITLVNYFEAIYVGISENLYDEAILRRHFRDIVDGHLAEYVASGLASRIGWSADFDTLSFLSARWRDENWNSLVRNNRRRFRVPEVVWGALLTVAIISVGYIFMHAESH